jgi:hypothetical protein
MTLNDNVYIYNKNEDNKWKYFDNNWSKYNAGLLVEHLPLYINTSKITLFFPDYSIETYEKGIDYALTINTWVNNKYVYLGTYIVNRIDALAANKIMDFHNQKYYECFEFEIPNAWDVIYSDAWRDWRVNVCGSNLYNDIEMNNDGSILNMTLYPVKINSDIYYKHDGYEGGQNAIKLEDYSNNLRYNLQIKKDEYPCMSIAGEIQFNKAYEQTYDGFLKYLKETYDIENCILKYDYYIQDAERVYGCYSIYQCEHEPETDSVYVRYESPNIKCELTKRDIANSLCPFDSWAQFIDGMYINGSMNIIDADNMDDEYGVLMTIMSNKIPLTKDLYSFLMSNENDINIDFIKLNLIDMNIFEINAVNKIQQNIIQIERPKDYKSNLIKPVYYRTRELAHVIFHPAVTENICINLDAYKSQASAFILQLEGVSFKEQARVSNGVIFKIVGNSLPGGASNGTYYILNQDGELVTTGKYTYEA